ncbi:MAG: sigma-54-dependent transcriptional regulator [bacterium]
MPRILVIDDDPGIGKYLSTMLTREGYLVSFTIEPQDGIEKIRTHSYDLVMIDIKMSSMDGIEVLKAIKEVNPAINIIMMTAFASTKSAVQSIKDGADDYITKPFKSIKDVLIVIENTLRKREESKKYECPHIIGRSPQMIEILSLVRRIGNNCSTALISGSSGTGKELIAKAIHYYSNRSKGPFITINCGAIPDTLLESEMFGHVKGSFTGAIVDKKGLFELANNGTLFLDEIGNTPVSIQVKLLRVLQEKEIRRVGSTENIQIDVRLIAATNSDLKKMVEKGKFREDLYYRLNVIPIEIPSLQERKEDIPLLAHHFLRIYRGRSGSGPTKLTDETISILNNYEWPGNVRELENAIERAVALCNTDTIMPADLPDSIHDHMHQDFIKNKIDLESIIDEIEKKYLLLALEKTGGNKTKAAEFLNLSFRSFRYRLKKYESEINSDGERV